MVQYKLRMEIISWNVNGIRAALKKGSIDWLFNESPDIFALQEIKAEKEQLPEILVNHPEYHAFFNSSKTRKGYSGVAVYSKMKPKKVEYGLGIEELDQEGRQISLFFDDFVFITTYFPNGGGGPERLAFKFKYYEAFLKYIEKLKKKYHVVFCGDVNTAHTEIDLARPKENIKNTGFLPEERAWIDSVIEKGWIDIFRYTHKDKEGAYTYWDQKTFARERNVGWRIDYFFISPSLLTKVKNTSILKDIIGSDHCPISLTLSLDEE